MITLHDLDFDYEIGNLTGGDYEILRTRYRTQIASILHQMDQMDSEHSIIADQIESEVLKLRDLTKLGRESDS